MSHESKQRVGTIGWIDLTVEHAERLKSFYSEVVGWSSSPVGMDGYDDFSMTNGETGGEPVAGICHATGSNRGMPPQWMIYITVENLDESASSCVRLGGKMVVDPRPMGEFGRYCVIRDPAGAVAALFEPAPEAAR